MKKNVLLAWAVMATFAAPFVIGWFIGGDAGVWMVSAIGFGLIVFAAVTLALAAIIGDLRR